MYRFPSLFAGVTFHKNIKPGITNWHFRPKLGWFRLKMTDFPCYSRFLRSRIVKTVNTQTANNEGRLYFFSFLFFFSTFSSQIPHDQFTTSSRCPQDPNNICLTIGKKTLSDSRKCGCGAYLLGNGSVTNELRISEINFTNLLAQSENALVVILWRCSVSLTKIRPTLLVCKVRYTLNYCTLPSM